MQNGYNLADNITIDGSVMTIKQLIQREIRRSICQQQFGATLTKNAATGEIISSEILISSIQSQLDNALGTSNTTGTLGAYLVNRTIYIYNGTDYVQESKIDLNLGIPTVVTDDLQWLYDISTTVGNIYLNIGVVI